MAQKTPYLAALMALCAVLGSSASSFAQLAAAGSSFYIASVGVRGNASAYDPKNNDFLAVAAYGSVTGRLLKPDGSFASGPFTTRASPIAPT
jgi:hypothetical protein